VPEPCRRAATDATPGTAGVLRVTAGGGWYRLTVGRIIAAVAVGAGMAEEATRLAAEAGGGAAPLVPGAVLAGGTWRLLRRLGAGGMGEVWRAESLVIPGAVAAIKAIRPELVEDELVRRLFLREAEALKSIRDDAVVGYEGAFKDEAGRVLIAMSFVDGPSLKERMRERPLSAVEVLRLMARLARGLAAAHRVGVHHRDLSPDNVLLPEGDLDRAVIVDFGIARRAGAGDGPTLFGPSAATSGFVGKLAYASPEQAGAVAAPVDHRSDIYSLGLVLAAAARGRPLEMGADPLAAAAARRSRPDLSGLPPPLPAVLAPLLQPDPAARPADMHAVEELAMRHLPGSPTRAAPAGRRLPWVAVAAGTVVLAVLGWAGFEILRPLPPQARLSGPSGGPEPHPTPTPAAPPSPFPAPGPTTAQAPPAAAGDPPSSAPVPAPVAQPGPVPGPTAAPTPVPPAPVPAAVDPARLEAQAKLLLRAFPCAEVRPMAAADGRIRLEGTVTGELERASLVRALAALPGAAAVEGGALGIRSRPHCEAALKVAGLVGPSRLGPVRLQLNRPEGVFTAGRDVLVATIRAPAEHTVWAYLDYYHENGEVYHLLPEPLAPDNRLLAGATLRVGREKAEAGPEDRVWEASEPYGEGRLVLVLSERPLFDGPRPIGEPAADYLAALQAAIEATGGAVRLGASELSVATRPGP